MPKRTLNELLGIFRNARDNGGPITKEDLDEAAALAGEAIIVKGLRVKEPKEEEETPPADGDGGEPDNGGDGYGGDNGGEPDNGGDGDGGDNDGGDVEPCEDGKCGKCPKCLAAAEPMGKAVDVPDPYSLFTAIEETPRGDDLLDAYPAMQAIASLFADMAKSVSAIAQQNIELLEQNEALHKSLSGLEAGLGSLAKSLSGLSVSAPTEPAPSPAPVQDPQGDLFKSVVADLTTQLERIAAAQQQTAERQEALEQAVSARPAPPHPKVNAVPGGVPILTKSAAMQILRKGFDLWQSNQRPGGNPNVGISQEEYGLAMRKLDIAQREGIPFAEVIDEHYRQGLKEYAAEQ